MLTADGKMTRVENASSKSSFFHVDVKPMSASCGIGLSPVLNELCRLNDDEVDAKGDVDAAAYVGVDGGGDDSSSLSSASSSNTMMTN